MKKPIPAGKKGKGIRKLKKVAPQVAKRMGYKKGKKVKSLKKDLKVTLVLKVSRGKTVKMARTVKTEQRVRKE
jgi:hypothetical protein